MCFCRLQNALWVVLLVTGACFLNHKAFYNSPYILYKNESTFQTIGASLNEKQFVNCKLPCRLQSVLLAAKLYNKLPVSTGVDLWRQSSVCTYPTTSPQHGCKTLNSFCPPPNPLPPTPAHKPSSPKTSGFLRRSSNPCKRVLLELSVPAKNSERTV